MANTECKKINGPLSELDDLRNTLVEVEGIVESLIYRSGFLGTKLVYSGVLRTQLDELICLSGSGTFLSTDGDLEASLLELSRTKQSLARITGRLNRSGHSNDPKYVSYELDVIGLEVEGIRSCFGGEYLT